MSRFMLFQVSTVSGITLSLDATAQAEKPTEVFMDEEFVGPRPEPVIDRVTRELRRYFRLINKQVEREEREAAELVRKEERRKQRAERRANRPPPEVRRKLRIARKEAMQMLSKPITLKARCIECGSLLKTDTDENLGRICKPCASRLRQLIPGFHSDESTEFAEISIVPGGAPGSGKRR